MSLVGGVDKVDVGAADVSWTIGRGGERAHEQGGNFAFRPRLQYTTHHSNTFPISYVFPFHLVRILTNEHSSQYQYTSSTLAASPMVQRRWCPSASPRSILGNDGSKRRSSSCSAPTRIPPWCTSRHSTLQQ